MNRIPGSRILEGVFAGGHLLLLLLFLGCATVLAGMAAVELWQALGHQPDPLWEALFTPSAAECSTGASTTSSSASRYESL